jgi:hypothetical protein
MALLCDKYKIMTYYEVVDIPVLWLDSDSLQPKQNRKSTALSYRPILYDVVYGVCCLRYVVGLSLM